jgi:hypothetical protein
MRKHALQEQLHNAEVESVGSEGELKALTPYRELPVIVEAWNKAYDDHFRKKNFVSFLRGTLKELDRAIEISTHTGRIATKRQKTICGG